jgi:hypothetical protein
MVDERKIAYFSMEIAHEAGMPRYSGGLGVLFVLNDISFEDREGRARLWQKIQSVG